MNLKLKSFVLFAFIGINAFSQINSSAYDKLVGSRIMAEQFFQQYGISEADIKLIKGSPYHKDFFQSGTIANSEGVVASGIPMRYNIFADEIEMRSSFNENDTEIKSMVKSPEFFAIINSENFVYVENQESKEKSGYFNVLVAGEFFDLYKKSSINYVEKKFAETSYQRDQPARFDRKDVYYLINKKGDFYEIPTNNKRSFFKIFNVKAKELESFVKSNRYDISKEEDLIKIIKHYNSIL